MRERAQLRPCPPPQKATAACSLVDSVRCIVPSSLENDDLLSLEQEMILLLPWEGGEIDFGGRAGDREALMKERKSCCRCLLSGAGSRADGPPPPHPRCRMMIRVLQPHIITATTIINISRWNMRNLLLHLSWKEYIVDQAGLKLAFRAIFYALLHVSVTRVLS